MENEKIVEIIKKMLASQQVLYSALKLALKNSDAENKDVNIARLLLDDAREILHEIAIEIGDHNLKRLVMGASPAALHDHIQEKFTE